MLPPDAFGYLQKSWRSPSGEREARHYRSGAYVGEYRLVLDGVPVDTGIIENVVFSPDGRRCAWIRFGEGGRVLVEDGRELARSEGLRGPWFSPDGTQLAWVETSWGQERAVIDGVEIERYPSIPWGLDWWGWMPPWDPAATPMPEEFRQAQAQMRAREE